MVQDLFVTSSINSSIWTRKTESYRRNRALSAISIATRACMLMKEREVEKIHISKLDVADTLKLTRQIRQTSTLQVGVETLALYNTPPTIRAQTEHMTGDWK